MPAWPGGPCPQCGEDMPENLIHCYNCRSLLNPDLQPDSVEVPKFIPLREIATMIEVEPVGLYVTCPACHKELRIHGKYVGQRVACKHCSKAFVLEPDRNGVEIAGLYTQCPHCSEELRIARKYLGQKVACKHCGGHIHFVEHAAK